MKSFAETGGKFKDAIVGNKNDHIPGGIEHGGADFAGLQVLVDVGAQVGIDIAVNVGGDVLPDVFAVDSHVRPRIP